jgi:hypothetical protein
MVYKYVRKASQGSWRENDMVQAIQEAALGTLNSVAEYMQRCIGM